MTEVALQVVLPGLTGVGNFLALKGPGVRVGTQIKTPGPHPAAYSVMVPCPK